MAIVYASKPLFSIRLVARWRHGRTILNEQACLARQLYNIVFCLAAHELPLRDGGGFHGVSGICRYERLAWTLIVKSSLWAIA